jgi:hypothetical protein
MHVPNEVGVQRFGSNLFLLRTKALADPSDLSWKEKRKMAGQEILSNY